MTPNLNIQPDIKVSLKQTFGIDSEMEVDAFSEKAPTSILVSIPKVCLIETFMSGSIFKLGVNFFSICIF